MFCVECYYATIVVWDGPGRLQITAATTETAAAAAALKQCILFAYYYVVT